VPGVLWLTRWGGKGSVGIPDSYAFSRSEHIDWRREPIRWGRAGRVRDEAHPRVYAHLMPRPADLTVTQHTSADAATLMDELCKVYADAYGAVPGEDASSSLTYTFTDVVTARSPCTRQTHPQPKAIKFPKTNKKVKRGFST
jgi:hypothetical protein